MCERERENFIKILNRESKLAPGVADKMKVTDILIERHDFIISSSEGGRISAAPASVSLMHPI